MSKSQWKHAFAYSMPNIRKRITDRGVPLRMLERASNEVRQGKSVRGVAKTYGICHVTLHRFHKKRQMLESKGSKTLPRVGYWTSKRVFSIEQELLLKDYQVKAADLYYGLSPKAHPGVTMTIYDLPGIVKSSLPRAASPGNIQAGFACSGIWPFNRDIFSESDFAPSSVTDRPPPAVTPEVPSSSSAPSPNVATVASSVPHRATSPVTPCVVSEPSTSAMDTTFHPCPSVHTQKLAQESRRQRAGKEGKPLSLQILL